MTTSVVKRINPPMKFAGHMKIAGMVFFVAGLTGLAGCNSTNPDGLKPGGKPKPVTLDPAPKGQQDGKKKIRYVPLDKQTYEIEYNYVADMQGFDVSMTREGVPLSNDTADDALVQNTIRDFFARNICSQGYYPGIMGGNTYGPRGSGKWVARVKCTSKRQQSASRESLEKAAAQANAAARKAAAPKPRNNRADPR